jgi:protein TonB
MATEKSLLRRRWKSALALLVGLAAIGTVGAGIYSLIKGKSGHSHKPPQISLLPLPPPPPPPPPKEEKKPEPKEQKEIKEEKPVEKQAAPPDNVAKMEGAVGNGPSPFAAGTVTRENAFGDSNLFGPFNSYAGLIKGELQRYLGKRSELRQSQYHVEVRVWVGADGRIRRSELIGSTGDADIDETLRQALASLASFSQAPPPNMPQPIRLRVLAGGRA